MIQLLSVSGKEGCCCALSRFSGFPAELEHTFRPGNGEPETGDCGGGRQQVGVLLPPVCSRLSCQRDGLTYATGSYSLFGESRIPYERPSGSLDVFIMDRISEVPRYVLGCAAELWHMRFTVRGAVGCGACGPGPGPGPGDGGGRRRERGEDRQVDPAVVSPEAGAGETAEGSASLEDNLDDAEADHFTSDDAESDADSAEAEEDEEDEDPPEQPGILEQISERHQGEVIEPISHAQPLCRRHRVSDRQN